MKYKSIKINVPDYLDNYLSIEIDEVRYWIRITWNIYGEYWKLGLYNSSKEPLYTGMRIKPNFPVNCLFNIENTPNGCFIVETSENEIGRYDFVNNVARLYYVPFGE